MRCVLCENRTAVVGRSTKHTRELTILALLPHSHATRCGGEPSLSTALRHDDITLEVLVAASLPRPPTSVGGEEAVGAHAPDEEEAEGEADHEVEEGPLAEPERLVLLEERRLEVHPKHARDEGAAAEHRREDAREHVHLEKSVACRVEPERDELLGRLDRVRDRLQSAQRGADLLRVRLEQHLHLLVLLEVLLVALRTAARQQRRAAANLPERASRQGRVRRRRLHGCRRGELGQSLLGGPPPQRCLRRRRRNAARRAVQPREVHPRHVLVVV
mmetsp:Transcript_12192/g.38494  ORF Transcript_12192/g.38494 Transcript_12192/m.38494 type:complete len:274 (+) Transcript_12192:26-847(+)